VDKGDKKLRKQKNVSEFVKLNLDLFKEILDPDTGWMSKVKNPDGKQRYFVKRGDQMVCQLNKFFMDLLEAKVEANPAVEEKNVRRSMDINALITFFEKGRATRPGAGRKTKPKRNDAGQAGQMSLEIDQQVIDDSPKPLVTKSVLDIINDPNAGRVPQAGSETPKSTSATFVSPSPNLPKVMTTQQVLDYCRKTINLSASIRQDLIRHLIKDNAPGAHDQAVEELRKILGCSIPTIKMDLEVINQTD
jgi:hypothetical protein